MGKTFDLKVVEYGKTWLFQAILIHFGVVSFFGQIRKLGKKKSSQITECQLFEIFRLQRVFQEIKNNKIEISETSLCHEYKAHTCMS